MFQRRLRRSILRKHHQAGGGPSLTGAVAANFWCVDSQENFSDNYAGYADVAALSNVAGNSQVRYSNVGTGSGNPDWTLQLGASYESAQIRYEMAAWLVSQYPGVSGNSANPVLASGATADEIQEAIWLVMGNTTSGTGFFPQFTTSDVLADPNIASYITQAEQVANYGSVKSANWAIVSWATDSGGTFLSGPSNYQTFLVDLATPTPEPGFYGVLAIALGGMFFAVRRRKSTQAGETPAEVTR